MNEKELAELKARADKNDPAAMFAYAEHIRPTDPAEADKLILLAAHMCYPPAAEFVGDRLFDAGDCIKARVYYKIGASGGQSDCAVKIAVIDMAADEHLALKELEDLAESGVMSACSALASYYKSNGNRKQYNHWKSLLKK